MQQMTGGTAVVIGGGGGVGGGISYSLVEAGMRVVIADVDAHAASKVVEDIREAFPEAAALHARADATDEASLAQLCALTVDAFDRVDVLVVAVGAILQRRLEEVTIAEWSWLWRQNVTSQVMAVNAFLAELRAGSGGHIVLTAAGAGFHAVAPDAELGAYGVVKHALVGYAKNLRGELVRDGIGVTVLCPTGIIGRLAQTSAASHREVMGHHDPGVGGHQPTERRLEHGRVLGPMVMEAIRRDRFLVSNEPEKLVSAVDEEHRSLVLSAREPSGRQE
jgi:NAD(P)-dependent dehydrogenase (short-subunit alcohol dehydrogenase family)